MARIKFRQFEQEMQPVPQVYDVPAFQDVPAPENKISDVLLSENVALEKLGERLLDLGTTAGKIVTQEQTRIRKQNWDNNAPQAMSGFKLTLEKMMMQDKEMGIDPAVAEMTWDDRITDEIRKIEQGKSNISGNFNNLHIEDQPKLKALLKATGIGIEIRAIRQAILQDNELDFGRFRQIISERLEEKKREIESPGFNKIGGDPEGEGNGHMMDLGDFTSIHVRGFKDKLIKNTLDTLKIDSPYLREQFKLRVGSQLNEFESNAINHHYKIKVGYGAAQWEQDHNELLATIALEDQGYRRKLGDEEEDPRLTKAYEHIERGVALRYILHTDDPKRRLLAQRIIDGNDANHDIENDTEIALARLRTDLKPEEIIKEKIEFFRQHEIELNKEGELVWDIFGKTAPTRPDNFDLVNNQWEEIDRNRGGFYPSIQGKPRQDLIERGERILEETLKGDAREIRESLDAGLRIILTTPTVIPSNDTTQQAQLERVLAPEYIEQHRGLRNFKGWELDQYKILYQYAMDVRKGAGDFTMLSNQGLTDVLERLDPANQTFSDVKEEDIFRKDVMERIHNSLSDEVSDLRAIRDDDKGAIGVKKTKERGINPLSEEGLMIILTDQLNYEGKLDFGGSAEQDPLFPSPRELKMLVSQERYSIWDKDISARVEKDWNALTNDGTGEAKQEFLNSIIRDYGAYAPVVLEEMFKMEGFSKADQLYSVIPQSNTTLLNSLNRAQKNSEVNKNDAAIIFGDDDATFENIRKQISQNSESEGHGFKELFMTYPSHQASLLDLAAYHVIQMRQEDRTLEVDDAITKASSHLVKGLYRTMEGGYGERVRVRIPVGEVGDRDPEAMNDSLEAFTLKFVEKKRDDQKWDFVGLEENALFGDNLYQWHTNFDETGIVLKFWNEDAGIHQDAKYDGQTATLTWKQLREINDAIPITKPSEEVGKGIGATAWLGGGRMGGYEYDPKTRSFVKVDQEKSQIGAKVLEAIDDNIINPLIISWENREKSMRMRLLNTQEKIALETEPVKNREKVKKMYTQKRKDLKKKLKIEEQEAKKKRPEVFEVKKEFYMNQGYSEDRAEKLAGMSDAQREMELMKDPKMN